MRTAYLLAAVVLATLPFRASLEAQETALKAPPLAELKAEVTQGLALTFTAAGKSDSREARLFSLFVPAGEPATPFLPAGQFTARWDGFINSPLRSEYTFAAESSGKFSLVINGKPVLAGTEAAESKPVQLNKGPNAVIVEYQSPAAGDAMFRLKWTSREFPFEPVQPAALSHNASSAELRTGERLRRGRLLFAQLHCTACHDGAGLLPGKDAPGAMPELRQDAPLLGDFGARYNEAWMAHWINDPHAIRPQTPMPRLFTEGADGKIDQRAADAAAYLASLGKPTDSKPAEDLAAAGGALFANLGCVACHTAPEFSDKDEHDRIPLSHIKAKWQLPALRAYLANPQATYQWARMPNFRLSEAELDRLTAFLLSGAQKEFAPGPKGDPARGVQLVATAGCLNCHAGQPPVAQPNLAATLTGGWTRGCLAPDAVARGKAPDFALTAADRDALQAMAAAGFEHFKQDSSAEFLQRQRKNLRCNACHSMDGNSSVWSQLDNETAPLTASAPAPEGEGQPIGGTYAPPFTWLGEKLQTPWAAQFIAGGIAYKPRPWLIARMPGFGVRAEGLARGMALEHGVSPAPIARPAVNEELATAGATLISENGGFNCTTCHGVGGRPPTAVFEAPGINLAYAPERLRHEYYHRWVYFPQRIDPDTKMPRFADDAGKTTLTSFFGGDARKQFEAIWQFLGKVTSEGGVKAAGEPHKTE